MEIQKPGAIRARARSSSASSQQLQITDNQSAPVLQIRQQDAALVGTVRFTASGDYREFTELFSHELELAAADVEEAGGLVGHVKAFVREEGRSCMISIPEPGELQIKQNEADSVQAEAALIVFQIPDAALRSIIHRHFDRWLIQD